jgi:hypothetical protein
MTRAAEPSPLPVPHDRAIRLTLEALDQRLQLLLRRLHRGQVEPVRLERDLRLVRAKLARLSRRLDQAQQGAADLPGP